MFTFWVYSTVQCTLYTEPVFVDLLRSPEIDSQPGGPLRQSYLTHRMAWRYRFPGIDSLESIHDSLNVYKFGLCWLLVKNLMTSSSCNLVPSRRRKVTKRPYLYFLICFYYVERKPVKRVVSTLTKRK